MKDVQNIEKLLFSVRYNLNVTTLPRLEWALFWIFIHSCSIWLFSIFLIGLTSAGFIANYFIYVLIMGFGITTVAKIIRTKIRRKQFRINIEFIIWICISAFSFWVSQSFLTRVFHIQNGIIFFFLMGFGIYICSWVASKILAIKIKSVANKSSFKINQKMHVKYGKNIKLEIKVSNYVNNERKKRHLPSLEWNASLYSASQRRANEIVDSFSHDNVPLGCGENIVKIPIGSVWGLGFVDRRNIARAFMKTWMNSAEHRENILRSNYSSICVGIVTRGKWYYGVQLFS